MSLIESINPFPKESASLTCNPEGAERSSTQLFLIDSFISSNNIHNHAPENSVGNKTNMFDEDGRQPTDANQNAKQSRTVLVRQHQVHFNETTPGLVILLIFIIITVIVFTFSRNIAPRADNKNPEPVQVHVHNHC